MPNSEAQSPETYCKNSKTGLRNLRRAVQLTSLALWVALFLLTTFSDSFLEEFTRPVKSFLRGEYGAAPRALVLIAVPLLVMGGMSLDRVRATIRLRQFVR